MRYIEISISKCDNDNRLSLMEGSTRINFSSGDEALALRLALKSRAEGRCVIIRPNFNEGGKHSFREWRSFNGSAFSEIWFRIGSESTTTVVPDAELKLPNVPVGEVVAS